MSFLGNISIMHSNIWNLRSSKQRLHIVQRTEAHKRHLINIITAKTTLNTHSSLSFRQPSSPVTLYRKRTIQQDNRNLAKKIASLTKSTFYHRQNDSLILSRNLQTYSSLNRSIRKRQIENENSRIFSRLITTSPTIRRDTFIKSHSQATKYKENLHRSKYRQPDYSEQACKLLSREPKFKNLNISFSERKSSLAKRPRLL